MSHFVLYKTVFLQLLRTEFIELRKTFLNKAIDLAIWVVCSVMVTQYLMGVHFNIAEDLNVGVFYLTGCVATIGLFDAYTYTISMVSDLEGPSIISYYFTLPIPSWFIFICKMIHWSFSFLFKVLIAFPLGQIVLWSTFNVVEVISFKTLFVILLSNILYGAFTLFIVSMFHDMAKAESIWMRIIFPLWFLWQLLPKNAAK